MSLQCSALVGLQVYVVTKLGVKVHLQVTQNLLDVRHSQLDGPGLLLQGFLRRLNDTFNSLKLNKLALKLETTLLKRLSFTSQLKWLQQEMEKRIKQIIYLNDFSRPVYNSDDLLLISKCFLVCLCMCTRLSNVHKTKLDR